MTDSFEKKLRKIKSIILREIRDGCPDCMDVPGGGFCDAHRQKAYDICMNPRDVPEVQELLKGSK